MLETVCGLKQVRHIGVLTNFKELMVEKMIDVSATEGTTTAEPATVVTEADVDAVGDPPAGEGELIEVVNACGIELADPTSSRTEV